MSLLSGIRFIPKSERKVSSDDDDSTSKQEKHEQKEQKHSKKRKHRKESKKERKCRTDRDGSSSEDEQKHHLKPQKKEKYDWRSDRRNSNSDKGNEEEGEDFHFEEFLREEQQIREISKSQIDRWKSGYDYEDDDQVLEKGLIEDNYSRDHFIASPSPISSTTWRAEKQATSPDPPTSSSIATVAAPTVTNKNIAALLRSKLKSSTKALEPEDVEDIRREQQQDKHSSSGKDDLIESVKYNKEFQLLKRKYHQLQSITAGSSKIVTNRTENLAIIAKQQKATKNVLSAMKSSYDEDNIDQVYASNILRLKGNYKGGELSSKHDGSGFTEEDNVDMSLFENRSSSSKIKGGSGKGASGASADETATMLKQQIQSSIKEQNKMVQILQSCQWCERNSSFPAYLVVGKTEHLVIRIKSHQYSLANGHFEILPREHVSSYLQCSEEIKKEIHRTLSCIQRMYEKILKKNLILFETVLRLQQRPHTVIEVLPVDRGMENDVQMFFREAFLSCDEEWAQHKKLIELNEKKTLDTAVPAHFPYLYVSWLLSHETTFTKPSKKEQGEGISRGKERCTGYVHPVENDSSIKHSFCYDIIAGILEEDVYRMRKGKPFSTSKERENVELWKRHWQEFDWTQYYSEG